MFATPYHCVATEMEKPFFFFSETEGACILLCLLLGGKRGGVKSCGHLCMGVEEWKQYNGGWERVWSMLLSSLSLCTPGGLPKFISSRWI